MERVKMKNRIDAMGMAEFGITRFEICWTLALSAHEVITHNVYYVKSSIVRVTDCATIYTPQVL